MRDAVHWSYPVWIADNGFVDLLLDVGLAGLVLAFALILLTGIRSSTWAFSNRTVESFSPVTMVVASLLLNIAYSLWIEIDMSVWLICVLALFSTTRTVIKPQFRAGRNYV